MKKKILLFLSVAVIVLAGGLSLNLKTASAATRCSYVGDSLIYSCLPPGVGFSWGVVSTIGLDPEDCSLACTTELTVLGKEGCWVAIGESEYRVCFCHPDGYISTEQAPVWPGGICTASGTTVSSDPASASTSAPTSYCGSYDREYSSTETSWGSGAFCQNGASYFGGVNVVGLPAFFPNSSTSISWWCLLPGETVASLGSSISSRLCTATKAPALNVPVDYTGLFDTSDSLCGTINNMTFSSYQEAFAAWELAATPAGGSIFCNMGRNVSMREITDPAFPTGGGVTVTWRCYLDLYVRETEDCQVYVPAPSATTCSDPDGSNIYSFGTTTYFNGTTTTNYTDLCKTTSRVIERICNGNVVANEEFDCPSGSTCSGGACSPSVSLSVNLTTINAGEKAVLRWEVSNADRCTGTSSPADPDWDGAKAFTSSNTQPDISPSRTTTYYIECFNEGGSSGKKSAVLSVSGSVTGRPTATITKWTSGEISGIGEASSGRTITHVEWSTGNNPGSVVLWNGPVAVSSSPAQRITDTRVYSFYDSTTLFFRVKDDEGTWSDYARQAIVLQDTSPDLTNTCGAAAGYYRCDDPWEPPCTICSLDNYWFCANDDVVPVPISPTVLFDQSGHPFLAEGTTNSWRCDAKTCSATREDCGGEEEDELPDPLVNLCGPAGSNDSTNPRVYSAYASSYTDNLCVYGDPNPATAATAFPSQGGIASWTCLNEAGDVSQVCYVSRNSVTPVTPTTPVTPVTPITPDVDDDDDEEDDDEDEEETTVRRIIRRVTEVIVPSFPRAGNWFEEDSTGGKIIKSIKGFWSNLF